jgi:tetratricopeptide (TPR) repeat protein
VASSEGKRETASALNNLGGLECLSGQLNFARALHLRARHLYEILGDHAGMALASSNLTNVALRQNDLSTARRRMNEALKEVQLTRALDDENLATIDSVKGALSRSEGNFPAAITAYQQAIELETHDCGLNCPKLGLLYALRAESYGFLEDYTSAAKDFQKALSLLAIQGINSRNYLKTELAYASILRATGDKAGAVRMEIEAHQRLENLGRAQCNGCTITAESFR